MPTQRAMEIFQSTPSVWRETFDASQVGDGNVTFQSTPSVWRETLFPVGCTKLG